MEVNMKGRWGGLGWGVGIGTICLLETIHDKIILVSFFPELMWNS